MVEDYEDETGRAARFAEALGKRSLTWLAKEVGAAVSTVSSYAKGKAPSGVVAYRIATILGVDLVWYLAGRGAMHPVARGEEVMVPRMVGDAVTGYMPFDLDDLASMGARPEDCFVTGMSGKAMAPTIPAGSDVLVVRGGPILDGEPHAVRIGDGISARRLQALAGGGWLAVCDNVAFPAEPLDKGAENVVGRIAMVITRFALPR